MSYSQLDARIEFEILQEEALETKDIEKAMMIRNHFEEIHRHEEADYWDGLARQWDNEEWAYDRNRDNEL